MQTIPVTNRDSNGNSVKFSSTGHSTPTSATGWNPIDALRQSSK